MVNFCQIKKNIFPSDLVVESKVLGFKKVSLNWTDSQKYVTSRFEVFINDKINPDTKQFSKCKRSCILEQKFRTKLHR
jgi:hypothetical protein